MYAPSVQATMWECDQTWHARRRGNDYKNNDNSKCNWKSKKMKNALLKKIGISLLLGLPEKGLWHILLQKARSQAKKALGKSKQTKNIHAPEKKIHAPENKIHAPDFMGAAGPPWRDKCGRHCEKKTTWRSAICIKPNLSISKSLKVVQPNNRGSKIANGYKGSPAKQPRVKDR